MCKKRKSYYIRYFIDCDSSLFFMNLLKVDRFTMITVYLRDLKEIRVLETGYRAWGTMTSLKARLPVFRMKGAGQYVNGKMGTKNLPVCTAIIII